MKIWIKPYLKRDGEIMYFINNDRKVSIGISAHRGYTPSKSTQGQKKLWEAFINAVRTATPIAEGADMNKHTEPHLTMFNKISFAITDIATVGGVSTGSDGLFIVNEGKILNSYLNDESC